MAEFRPHPWQVKAVGAYFEHGGVFVGLDPGVGKSYAAAMIAARCPRPLVLAPASVIPQTRAMFEAYGVPGVQFMSYTALQQAKNAEALTELKPTDILCDEFHLIRNLRTNSAGKRLNRYLLADWSVRVGVFTGSPWGTKLEDMAHGLRFALRKKAPLPPTADGIAMLSERMATDVAAREAWCARLAATPGVFLDAEGAGVYPGRIQFNVVRREPALALNPEQQLPDGYFLIGPAQATVVARQMAWGWWPRVTPRPSARYLEARRMWSATVRRVIDRGSYDTESQVAAARPDEYAAFAAVAATEPEPKFEAVWESDASLREVLATVQPRTLVFAFSTELQRRASEILGCPWHHEHGLDAGGVRLDQAKAPVVVASLTACHQGFNCQYAFERVMFLDPQANQEIMKQAIARVARQGQPRDVVTVDLVVNCREAQFALDQSILRARVAFEATGKKNPLLQLEGKV